jgi:hypothetical protein
MRVSRFTIHAVDNTENRAPDTRRASTSGAASITVERVDLRVARPVPTGLDHGFDRLLRTCEHGFHAAIVAVAHPAFELVRVRAALHEGAIADALNAAANNDMADDVHAISPVSVGRAPR